MKHYDIIVVGAGILGISHAYHCLKAGLKVALVERNPYPIDSTVRNFGQVVPSGFGTEWQAYARESLTIYNELQSKVDITVRQEGSIYLASNEEEIQLIEELAEINKSNSYESQLFTKAQCISHLPGVNEDYVKAGLFFSQEIVVDPRVLAKRLINYLVENEGLVYYPNTPILEVVKSDKVVLTTAKKQQLSADKTIICSGSEYELLFPDLFSQSGILLVKLQMLDTVPQSSLKMKGSVLTGWTIRRYEAFQECKSYADIKAKEDKHSYQKEHGVHILFKQSLDGSVVIGDSHHYQNIVDGNRMDYLNDNALNDFMINEAKKIYNLDNWKIRSTWNGVYSQLVDGDILNKTIDEDIHIVTAIGGKGMSASLGYAKHNLKNILNIIN